MANFAVQTEAAPEAVKFMLDTKERLKSNNILRNPFTGDIILVPNSKHTHDGNIYLIKMEPIYPKYELFAVPLLSIPLFFTGLKLTWWLLPGVFVASFGVFKSVLFMYIMLKIGLKRAQYEGKVKLLSKDELIGVVIRVLGDF